MANLWYYVAGTERVGPIEENEFFRLISGNVINDSTFVWKKGMPNWIKYKDALENNNSAPSAPPAASKVVPLKKNFEWRSINSEDKIFTIKIGVDRGGDDVEYGPFSKDQLTKLYEENRINGKTLVFSVGMNNWEFISETPIFKTITPDLPPIIEESDRRSAERKPFVARIFFHNSNELFEGVCRDISAGGLMILVNGFPGKIGDQVSMNVHPDNSDFSFVASGKIVRKLDADQGVSLQFEKLTERAQKIIEEYVRNP
jgi:hypothetical protein